MFDSVPAPRQRNIDEQAQYIEDRKVALMLQNEEFLRELRRNEQFLQELSKGRTHKGSIARAYMGSNRLRYDTLLQI